MIKIGELEIQGCVYIPPMAGYTDLVYRKLCREFDPDVLLSTEMLSSKALSIEKESVYKAQIPEGENLTGIQLFGHEPEIMSQSAIKAEKLGARFIDINMGCPVPKIVNGKDGAALMKEPDLALKIVQAVISSVSIPVTVKMRLGWCEASLNARQLAEAFQEAGVKALTIHGRTRTQRYEGKADWYKISDVVKSVSIPVFANGDVKNLNDAQKILEITGASGLAIARATMGRPWFSRQINEFFKTGKFLNEPSPEERISLALRHCKMLIEFRGEQVGAREARKHIVNYVSGIKGASQVRAKLSSLNSYEAAQEILSNL
jgi:tRNA-dihydrouridine synthase B